MENSLKPSYDQKEKLKSQAMRDPKVLEALQKEFEFRNRARRILAEKEGEKNPAILKQIQETITLEEMIQKAQKMAA